ncbi:MAG: BolA family transcriptional regulator [Hyphomonas sp.]|uniref:BolA family protein n=1 Tax=Hyphomonas sp. TaxID=87 RepID=UPI0017BCD4D1|nr:BolA family transcriptional regulator [Hyphomonas sp.]MBA3068573.1 BolA family transcriptional regulator [Hyphomonas sp.]MBU3920439.1 BolA family transcriptional regulator [Alphaproteobacteria bacterium]MBU4061892.1 BolA family transcriptional regulator [Alphaproteobacteria bacterium]MBU4166047.1 BolA family transcriptional regulator [Alphaproteobacteria bacterium]
MPQPSDRRTRIEEILVEAFAPVSLSIIDDSTKHAGHAGAAPGGETHYSVEIVAEAFAGLSRVQVQRTVMLVLQTEFDTGLHALALKASAPA